MLFYMFGKIKCWKSRYQRWWGGALCCRNVNITTESVPSASGFLDQWYLNERSSCFILCSLCIFNFLEMHRQRRVPISWFTLRMPTEAGLMPGHRQEAGTQPRHLLRCHRVPAVSCCLPQGTLAGRRNGEQTWGFTPWTPVGISSCCLTGWTKHASLEPILNNNSDEDRGHEKNSYSPGIFCGIINAIILMKDLLIWYCDFNFLSEFDIRWSIDVLPHFFYSSASSITVITSVHFFF